MKTKLIGRSACPGYAQGSAFVMNKNGLSSEEMLPGQILVLKYSSPEYFDFYLKASAIVTQLGGVTCHAASLARDLNIPCVVAVQNLIKTIKTGDNIIVNANEGEIYV